jgi:hypothetical protein
VEVWGQHGSNRLAGPDRHQGSFVIDCMVDARTASRTAWAWSPDGRARATVTAPTIEDAGPQLRADDGAGVQRLVRLVDQRLRDESKFVRVAPVEPLVELLLDDETPWASSKPERTLLMDWLRSLARSSVPDGYTLRETMRARRVVFCAAADERLRAADEEREAERAAREAAMMDEERAEREARFQKLPRSLCQEHGYPRSRPRRMRPVISREITDETVVELFALLGADLGAEGEAVLRRIAESAGRSQASSGGRHLRVRARSLPARFLATWWWRITSTRRRTAPEVIISTTAFGSTSFGA